MSKLFDICLRVNETVINTQSDSHMKVLVDADRKI